MSVAFCTISGTVLSRAAGAPLAGRLVRVRLLDEPSVFDGEPVDATAQDAQTGEDGSWSVQVPQTSFFMIEIPCINLRHAGQAPAVSSVTFANLIADLKPVVP